jgi:hypothetical protein
MRLFSKAKEIRSKAGELHFERYAIIELPFFAIYIHKIHKADKDPHLHSHPWNFMTLTLKGSYLEKYLNKDLFCEGQTAERIKKPGSFASAGRNYFHKIEEILDGPVYTLFITMGVSKTWFYSVNDKKIDFVTYRQMKHSAVPNEVNSAVIGQEYTIK